ncbi:unnamed protein product [Cylicocyclus nassatus]|uniref:Uncharacterized protein n=1 Tax=Cylicocyclus nassatus TaxID=53992 RepID=A0AA36GP79_CYLNA|nr:unnamed protein product [Cylicocyclus nassatus]
MFQKMCTIFKSGEVNQVGRGNVFALDRQLVLPTCERPLPLASNVEFQQLPEPTEAQSDARKVQLLAINTTAPLTIIDWIGLSGSVFYSKDISKMPDAALNHGSLNDSEAHKLDFRLVFAKEPNPECVSIPVFQRASQRRLYFGDVYNVTGYTFLDAYAFTDRCACAGICCGQVSIFERFAYGSYHYFHQSSVGLITEVSQTLYIAGILNAENRTVLGMSKTGC